jgi:hypothetical protein
MEVGDRRRYIGLMDDTDYMECFITNRKYFLFCVMSLFLIR